MKWWLGTAAVVIVAVVAWGVSFSFDFKEMRADAVSSAVAKTANKDGMPTIKVKLTPEQKEKAKEHSEGDVNAPIAMYEFSSLTCSHCAHFHLNGMPNLQKYIDNGDLVVYFKDIFMDRRAAAATLLTRCVTDNDKYWKFLHALFEMQQQWAYSPDYEKFLLGYASMQGIDEQTAKACMSDKNLLKALVMARDDYSAAYSIMGTPTIILAYNGKTEHVNHADDGQFIARRIEEILEEIEQISAKKEAAKPVVNEAEPVLENQAEQALAE